MSASLRYHYLLGQKRYKILSLLGSLKTLRQSKGTQGNWALKVVWSFRQLGAKSTRTLNHLRHSGTPRKCRCSRHTGTREYEAIGHFNGIWAFVKSEQSRYLVTWALEALYLSESLNSIRFVFDWIGIVKKRIKDTFPLVIKLCGFFR